MSDATRKQLEAERDKLKAEMAYDAEHIKSLRAELEQALDCCKRVGELEAALDDIRLALDDQYGADAWRINRILERVDK